MTEWRLHTALLGPHPFAYDGTDRYVGYRPQALFEHGNQYGIWCAGAALAAYWRLRVAISGKPRAGWSAAAIILLVMTLASQSAGALLFLFAGYAMLTRSEEHTSELQSLMRISYAVFRLKKKKIPRQQNIKHLSIYNKAN